jgi:hypothetical protein
MRRLIERHIILWVDNDLHSDHLGEVAAPKICSPRLEPEVASKRIE